MCADIVQPCLVWYYIRYSRYQTHPFHSSQLASCWSSLKHRWSWTSSPGLLAESGVPYILAHPAMLMCHHSIYRITSVSSFYYIYLAVPGLICGMQNLWSSLWHANSQFHHVGSSFPTRDRTWVPCIGSTSLSHWTTRKVPTSVSSFSITPSKLGDAHCVSIVYFSIVESQIKNTMERNEETNAYHLDGWFRRSSAQRTPSGGWSQKSVQRFLWTMKKWILLRLQVGRPWSP